jgi:tRNA dimethylallyltransferase
MDARLPSMRLVGYRQVWRYLNGDYDVDKMQERAIVASRQLAKRQLTWLRSESDTTWFDASDSGLFDKIMKFLSDSTKLCI